MHLRVTWTTRNGTEHGDLTGDELPLRAERHIPLVISDDGRTIMPRDVAGVVLHVAGPRTEEAISLIRAAVDAGYTVDETATG